MGIKFMMIDYNRFSTLCSGKTYIPYNFGYPHGAEPPGPTGWCHGNLPSRIKVIDSMPLCNDAKASSTVAAGVLNNHREVCNVEMYAMFVTLWRSIWWPIKSITTTTQNIGFGALKGQDKLQVKYHSGILIFTSSCMLNVSSFIAFFRSSCCLPAAEKSLSTPAEDAAKAKN